MLKTLVFIAVTMIAPFALAYYLAKDAITKQAASFAPKRSMKWWPRKR